MRSKVSLNHYRKIKREAAHLVPIKKNGLAANYRKREFMSANWGFNMFVYSILVCVCNITKWCVTVACTGFLTRVRIKKEDGITLKNPSPENLGYAVLLCMKNWKRKLQRLHQNNSDQELKNQELEFLDKYFAQPNESSVLDHKSAFKRPLQGAS
ncbi:jg23507 [Pararge aegeria aegeria]|uniref:Jg23507 protein n=1 Tax=Pararge aegeria aegeria TaxID=348720 RepID=A0A8S4RDN7_9NEOP|nr:jg23507 [Pararge aegeria aegeria]